MAYVQTAPATPANQNNSQRKEADSFLNISMMFGERKVKLAFVAIDTENANMKVLHDHLMKNPDDAQKLAPKLILEWRENKKAPASATAEDLFA